MDIEEAFINLFDGNRHALGTEQGGCLTGTPEQWERAMRAHLHGTIDPIGVYPLTDADTVKWGCVDIDIEDLPLAMLLRRCLHAMGIQAWVERSRSKGYHVWVFAECFVPAATMRRALMAACETIGYDPKEVNPKQEDHSRLAKGFGNYVRLPYPRALAGDGWTTDQRRMVIDEHGPLDLTLFVECASATPTPLDTLTKWADTWTPPKRTTVIYEEGDNPALDELIPRLPGLAYTIFMNGPLEGRDRSDTLVRFSYLLHESEAFTAAQALALLREADRRWGKFFDRADGEEQLLKIIEKSYGRA